MKTQRVNNLSALLLALAIAAGASLPALADNGQLIIKATGFKSDTGQALFAVADSPEAYDAIAEKACAKSKQKITEGKAETSFALPYGWYVVSVVHDKNNNIKMDTNFLGIPKEPYGFSNNPKAIGKPSFDQVKFRLGAGQKIIEVIVD